MTDQKTYDEVVKLFLGGKWRDASCAMSVYDDSIFISVYPQFMATPLTMRMSVDLFIRIADLLREEDEEIEDCDDEMDIDDQIFARLESLEERVARLETKPTVNGKHSGGYYVMDFPSNLVARLVNS
jgi:hypothetical protein